MTPGEYRVGLTFNPSGDDRVTQIKRAAAALIDLIMSEPISDGEADAQIYRAAEVTRLNRLAAEAIEAGAMWAVKAATKPVVDSVERW